MAKKIILLMVEGQTDSTALKGILSEIFNDNRIEFCLVETDITTKSGITPNNIRKELGSIVGNYLNRHSFNRTDVQEVIHLVDIDDTYIAESNIIEDTSLDCFIYSENNIKAKDINQVIVRNNNKKDNMEVLINTSKVLKEIPYRVYYLSQNLEHFFHDRLNCTRVEKNRLAENLEDKYIDDLEGFLTFIRDVALKSSDDYNDSWDYIKQSTNSLSRCSNIHIFLKDK